MDTVTQMQSSEQVTMPIPANQDVLEPPVVSRDQWIDKAAFALYEARRAEFPEAYPLSFHHASKAVRGDFHFLAMSAYRRSLPLVRDELIEMVAMTYANLEGWCYPDCDNKPESRAYDQVEGNAIIAQRRQLFRHKARKLLAVIWPYLEIDCDTEAQRKHTLDVASGQMHLDATAVTMWRKRKGFPSEVNHG